MESGALNVLWRELPIDEFLSLCQTNIYMRDICNRDDTWRFLIERDFKIKYQDVNPRRKYIELQDKSKNRNILEKEYITYIFMNRNRYSPDIYLAIVAKDEDELYKILSTEYLNNLSKVYPNRESLKDYIQDNIIEDLSGDYHIANKPNKDMIISNDRKRMKYEKEVLGIEIPDAKRSLYYVVNNDLFDGGILLRKNNVIIGDSFIQ